MNQIKKIEGTLQSYATAITEIATSESFQSPQVYAHYLAQTYYYVSHSTRLLAYAATKTPFKRNAWLSRLAEHIAEENNHELLAKKDLDNLEYHLDDFPQFLSTKELYEAQFGKIFLYGDYPLMGYILALEYLAISAGKIMYKHLQNFYTESQLSFLRVHVTEDEHHIKEALEALALFNQDELEMIVENIHQTCTAFQNMLLQCSSIECISSSMTPITP